MSTFVVRTTIDAKVEADNEDDAIEKYNLHVEGMKEIIAENYRVEAFEVHPGYMSA